MPLIRSISVLMPTWQGMEFLERSLDALRAQVLDLAWDFLAVDSGSTDGTWECLGRYAETFPVPFRRRRIHQVEFDHGDTRNLMAALSEGDLLVFLTQDAIPSDERFLAKLAANFEDEEVGAAYCRNVPRPDAELLTKVFSAGDPGYATERRVVRLPDRETYAALNPHERRVLYNFNDVASAIRRTLWERHPFPRTEFGEDVLMARALLEAGYAIVYDAHATVEHSHDYDAEESRKRAWIDGKFSAEWLDRICIASRKDAHVLAGRQLETDREALDAAGLGVEEFNAEFERARGLRVATFEGLWDGGRSERRHPATRVLTSSSLHVLYVVHGFPPDTWAGTEIYTLNLATEMRRRGHRVTVLARVPAAGPANAGPPDFSIEESEFQGLRVLRMTHRLQHASVRESYDQPKAERAFRRVLLREAPDLVHFQHLIHLSAGIVHVARELGLPTIVHLHDYWALCARVQLIRPDGRLCDANMGLGCHLCIKETGLAHVERARALGATCAPIVRQFAVEGSTNARPGTRADRTWSGLADVLDRQPTVLAAYAAADLRISPSRFLREKLLESGAFDPRTTLYSDNGMRTDHVHALEKVPDPEGRVRFGFVGSLVWYKGGETMVRAMRRLAGRAAVLNVYGDFKPDSDAHHAELARLAEGAAVHFNGRFDNSRLSEVYAEIDVLVVPSVWYENSPITIHEAYLTGTPVLASGIGGMAEYVRDGVDGLHFAVGDDADLARKMARFLDEPGLVEALSRDFMEIKTIRENALETEFRYRALLCREREPAATTRTLELEGVETAAHFGAVTKQGADMLLLGPEDSAVEYDVSGLGGGRRTVEIQVPIFGQESGVVLSGRVLVDGREVASLPAMHSTGSDEVRVHTFEVDLGPEARRVRLENQGHLRVRRIVLREAGA